MANFAFSLWSTSTVKADKDWDTADFRAFLTSSGYTPNQDTHDYLNDVTNIISDVVALTSETVAQITAGARLTAATLTITGVTGTGARIIIYDHAGGADPARMLAFNIDTASSGLPTGALTAGTVTVTWHANGLCTVTS
jgi:hypothetical protein